MKFKEAQKATGLSAKAIRLYEEKGLVHVKRQDNDYREYDEADIKQLLYIKALRKLGISIGEIKQIQDRETSLRDVLTQRKNILKEESEKKEILMDICDEICKDLEKGKPFDETKVINSMDFLESEAYNDIKEMSATSLGAQILFTFLLSGPILFLLYYTYNENYVFLPYVVPMALLFTSILAISWYRWLLQPYKPKGHGFLNFLIILFTIVCTLAIFAGISILQDYFFVSADYLLYKTKAPYSFLPFVFEVEILMLAAYWLYKLRHITMDSWIEHIIQKIFRFKWILIAGNILLLYMSIVNVLVIQQDGTIYKYTTFHPNGSIYTLADVEQVKTGFHAAKLFHRPDQNAGDFYYILTMNDGTVFDVSQSNSPFVDDTYVELEMLDTMLDEQAEQKPIKKITSTENYEYCDLDPYYISRFLRIVENAF